MLKCLCYETVNLLNVPQRIQVTQDLGGRGGRGKA